jgi:hypothetical protein
MEYLIMKFSLFKEYGALNSVPVFAAFEASLIQAGHTVLDSDMHADVAVIWSVLWNGRMSGNKPIWDYYTKTGRNVIVLEVGGIQRGTTWRVGLNGINRSGILGPTGQDSSRAKKLGLQLQPWRDTGNAILICGQHDKSLQWKNQPRMSTWFLQTYETIRQYSQRPIIFRPHPRCRLEHIERGLKNVYRQDPLQLTKTYDCYDLKFDNIWATVSWSSNPGPQSVINGVPAFVGPDSVAFDVANVDLGAIENPLKSDRTQWLNDYAWTEYTVEEIAKGIPLEYLTKHIDML